MTDKNEQDSSEKDEKTEKAVREMLDRDPKKFKGRGSDKKG